jgi:hypothetical protein
MTPSALRPGSRVVSLPDSIDTLLGISGPRLVIIDEAGQVSDETFRGAATERADGLDGGSLVELIDYYTSRPDDYRRYPRRGDRSGGRVGRRGAEGITTPPLPTTASSGRGALAAHQPVA